MRFVDKVAFIILFFVLLFISLNRHSHHPIFNYHSQLFADKAGYHVYFPAYWYCDMDAKNMPDSIDIKTGQGFRFEGDKIITKYPIGVAICQLPFSLIAAVSDSITGNYKSPGFTESHHLALNWATALWSVLGLLLVFLTAIRFWKLSYSQAYLLVFALLFLSNLLYYTTRDCGMSHAYSFTVFAAINYIVWRFSTTQVMSNLDVVLLMIFGGLVVALRPLNGVFIVLPLGYVVFSMPSWKSIYFKPKWLMLLLGLVIAVIPLVLQGLYNQYAYGKIIADGYVNEGFSNLMNMNIVRLWFAPHNGVFIYSPILLFVWLGVIIGSYKNRFVLLFIVYFMIISLTYAAWWSPELGCGFGHRGFTEHLAFFAFPISTCIKRIPKSKQWISATIMSIVGILLFIAQYNFDGCWPSENDWDWELFIRYFKP